MKQVLRKIVGIFNPPPAENKPGKPLLHFLHIGKTGGNAIKFALKNSPPEKYSVELHRHRVKLRNVPEGEKAMFFVREPISRFVSGFYSRKRQGYPRYVNKWSPAEEIAFGRFETPNALAMALSSEDPEQKLAAEEAMKGITHVNSSYWDWFENEEYFLSRLPDLFFVGFQESLAENFQVLKRKLNLPDTAALPTDDINTHRNPEGIDKKLEPVAIENLKKWYAREFDFMDLCRSKAEEINRLE